MYRNLFYKAFPPPKFLSMPAVGVDISDSSIHFVELKSGKNGLVVSDFGEKEIATGVIEGGEIKNPKKLIEILTVSCSSFNTPFVNVSLPEQRAYLFKLHIPKMKRSEIRSSVELQLEENVPISAREAVFDYDIVERAENGQRDIELSVLPRSVVESYMNVFKDSGLIPISFEIEAQAITRAVIPEGDMGTFMVVDFGKTRSGISIVSNGITRFTSTVDIGGNSLTKAIEKTLKIKPEKAEAIKKEKGIVSREENEDLFLTMMSIVGVLRDEINKHYIYWHTHKDQYGKKRLKIEKIIMCGGDANLAGLPEYLSSSLNIHVERANVIVNINSFDKYVPEISFSESLHYATAIGLALRQYTKTNA